MKNFKCYKSQKGDKFCLAIYFGSDESSHTEMYHYIRIQNIETNIFPHGIPLGSGNKFKTKVEADTFRDTIAEYLGFTEII